MHRHYWLIFTTLLVCVFYLIPSCSGRADDGGSESAREVSSSWVKNTHGDPRRNVTLEEERTTVDPENQRTVNDSPSDGEEETPVQAALTWIRPTELRQRRPYIQRRPYRKLPEDSLPRRDYDYSLYAKDLLSPFGGSRDPADVQPYTSHQEERNTERRRTPFYNSDHHFDRKRRPSVEENSQRYADTELRQDHPERRPYIDDYSLYPLDRRHYGRPFERRAHTFDRIRETLRNPSNDPIIKNLRTQEPSSGYRERSPYLNNSPSYLERRPYHRDDSRLHLERRPYRRDDSDLHLERRPHLQDDPNIPLNTKHHAEDQYSWLTNDQNPLSGRETDLFKTDHSRFTLYSSGGLEDLLSQGSSSNVDLLTYYTDDAPPGSLPAALKSLWSTKKRTYESLLAQSQTFIEDMDEYYDGSWSVIASSPAEMGQSSDGIVSIRPTTPESIISPGTPYRRTPGYSQLHSVQHEGNRHSKRNFGATDGRHYLSSSNMPEDNRKFRPHGGIHGARPTLPAERNFAKMDEVLDVAGRSRYPGNIFQNRRYYPTEELSKRRARSIQLVRPRDGQLTMTDRQETYDDDFIYDVLVFDDEGNVNLEDSYAYIVDDQDSLSKKQEDESRIQSRSNEPTTVYDYEVVDEEIISGERLDAVSNGLEKDAQTSFFLDDEGQLGELVYTEGEKPQESIPSISYDYYIWQDDIYGIGVSNSSILKRQGIIQIPGSNSDGKKILRMRIRPGKGSGKKIIRMKLGSSNLDQDDGQASFEQHLPDYEEPEFDNRLFSVKPSAGNLIKPSSGNTKPIPGFNLFESLAEKTKSFGFGRNKSSISIFGGKMPSLPIFGGKKPSLPMMFGGKKPSLPMFGGKKPSLPMFGGKKPSLPMFGGKKPSLPTFGGKKPSLPTFGGKKPSLPMFGGKKPSLPMFGVMKPSLSIFSGKNPSMKGYGGKKPALPGSGGGKKPMPKPMSYKGGKKPMPKPMSYKGGKKPNIPEYDGTKGSSATYGGAKPNPLGIKGTMTGVSDGLKNVFTSTFQGTSNILPDLSKAITVMSFIAFSVFVTNLGVNALANNTLGITLGREMESQWLMNREASLDDVIESLAHYLETPTEDVKTTAKFLEAFADLSEAVYSDLHETIRYEMEALNEKFETYLRRNLSDDGSQLGNISSLYLLERKDGLLPDKIGQNATCYRRLLCLFSHRYKEHTEIRQLPLWTFGNGWLKGKDQLATLLENLRAELAGLSGRNCYELYPDCPDPSVVEEYAKALGAELLRTRGDGTTWQVISSSQDGASKEESSLNHNLLNAKNNENSDTFKIIYRATVSRVNSPTE